VHIIYPRAIVSSGTAKEMGFTKWRNQDCTILPSMLVLSVYISPLTIYQSFQAACIIFQTRRCASSLSTSCPSSPCSTMLGIKKQPTPQSAIRGTIMMNTARTPFILASARVLEERALPSPGRADCVTAYCTAVLTANPVTAPSIRIRLRVLVATARSCGLQCAWSATRAGGLSVKVRAARRLSRPTWLVNETNADAFNDECEDFSPYRS
jgi:hypothetical protein